MEGGIALAALHTRCPKIRPAVDPAELRWGHGDALVLSLDPWTISVGDRRVNEESAP
jgi:hypothetical protein